MDLAAGDPAGLKRFDTSLSIEAYGKELLQSRLIANSSKAAALLSDVSREIAEHLYKYGRHIGLAKWWMIFHWFDGNLG